MEWEQASGGYNKTSCMYTCQVEWIQNVSTFSLFADRLYLDAIANAKVWTLCEGHLTMNYIGVVWDQIYMRHFHNQFFLFKKWRIQDFPLGEHRPCWWALTSDVGTLQRKWIQKWKIWVPLGVGAHRRRPSGSATDKWKHLLPGFSVPRTHYITR